jgi:hypothetical protein
MVPAEPLIGLSVSPEEPPLHPATTAVTASATTVAAAVRPPGHPQRIRRL